MPDSNQPSEGVSTIQQWFSGRSPQNLARVGRKLPRRDPEKRRVQNLQAQKRYREKRKRKIDQLEKLVESIPNPSHGQLSESHDDSWLLESGLLEDLNDHAAADHELPLTEPDSVPAAKSSILSEWENDPGFLNAFAFDIAEDAEAPATAALECTNTFEYDHRSIAQVYDCGCRVPHIALRLPTRLIHKCLIAEHSPMADPYMNSIRIERECVISAFYQNCLAIGISPEMWCTADSISPFFRETSSLSSASLSLLPPGASSDALVTSVQAIFKTLRFDMRPRREQITTPHHPYIDILPFPTLRENLVKHKDTIDEDEFFYDSLSGLVCWGNANISRANRLSAGSGTPWEARSWEAKAWFLQKWEFLLGGEDNDIARQSMWWRSMRGED